MDEGTYLDTLLDQVTWWDHVDYLCRSRVSDRSSSSYNQDRTRMDTLVSLDPMVIIFRSVKHSYRPFECHGVIRVREVLFGECGRDDGSLHDGTVEQCSLKVQETGGWFHGFFKRPNDSWVVCEITFTVFAHCFTGYSEGVGMGESVGF